MSTGESLDSTSHLTIRSPLAQYIFQELTPIQVHVSRQPLVDSDACHGAFRWLLQHDQVPCDSTLHQLLRNRRLKMTVSILPRVSQSLIVHRLVEKVALEMEPL